MSSAEKQRVDGATSKLMDAEYNRFYSESSTIRDRILRLLSNREIIAVAKMYTGKDFQTAREARRAIHTAAIAHMERLGPVY